jgi:hypothetical protein
LKNGKGSLDEAAFADECSAFARLKELSSPSKQSSVRKRCDLTIWLEKAA